MPKELTVQVMREIMSRADGEETLPDEILQIVVDEISAGLDGAEARIRARAEQLPEHPAAYFLLGFAAMGAALYILS